MLQTLLAFQGSQRSHCTNKYQATQATHCCLSSDCRLLVPHCLWFYLIQNLALVCASLQTRHLEQTVGALSWRYSLLTTPYQAPQKLFQVSHTFSYATEIKFQIHQWIDASHTSPITQMVLSLSRLTGLHSGHSSNALGPRRMYYI